MVAIDFAANGRLRSIRRARRSRRPQWRLDVVKLAKALARRKPKGGKLSLRAISAELAARDVLNERNRPFAAKSIATMLAARTY